MKNNRKSLIATVLRIAAVFLIVLLLAGCDDLLGSLDDDSSDSNGTSNGGGTTDDGIDDGIDDDLGDGTGELEEIITGALQNLPNRFSVDAPKSLRKNVSSLLGGTLAGRSLDGEGSEDTFAYDTITDQVQDIEELVKETAVNFVMADSIISSDEITLGTSREAFSYTFTFTEAVVNQMVAIFQDSVWWEEGDEEFYSDMVGMDFDMTVSYTALSEGNYNHKLTIAYGDNESVAASIWGQELTDDDEGWPEDDYDMELDLDDISFSTNMQLRWNTDRTRVNVVDEYEFSFDEESFSGTQSFTYNETDRTALAVMTSESDEWGSDYYEINMREDLDSDKNGVFLNATMRFAFDEDTMTFTTRGRADDEGGRIAFEFITPGEPAFRSEYTFDAEGQATSASYDFDDDAFDGMSAAGELEEIGLEAGGYMVVAFSGVEQYSDYVLTTSEEFDPEGDWAAVVGFGYGLAEDELEVILWDEPTGAVYVHKVDWDADSATAAKLDGTLTLTL